MKNLTQKIRTIGICLMTATVISLPATGHAGWFSDAKPVKKVVKKVKNAKVVKKVAGKARETADNIQDKVEDISNKLNELVAQIDENQPLLDVIKDGRLMSDLTDIMLFLNEQREDYQQFADSGIHTFQRDVTNLLYGFGDIAETMKLQGVADKLDNAHNVIGKMPAQLMYILEKGMGKKINELNDDVHALNEKLEVVADLPPNRELLKNPEIYRDKLCPLVNDRRTKVTYTVIMGRMKLLGIAVGYINDMIPDEITVVANVVAGGGTSAPNPAKAVSKTIKFISDSITQRLENAGNIAGAVCE